MNTQFITRKGTFDSGHRVMNEFMKCFNIHGHTYLYELTFEYDSIQRIGYAIDFKEIKRVACEFIDRYFDHGMLLNPEDKQLIQTTKDLHSKYWLMSLNGEGKYCNPTVENIGKELFILLDILWKELSNIEGGEYIKETNLNLHMIRLYETPNCYSDTIRTSCSNDEYNNVMNSYQDVVKEFVKSVGNLDYDDRNK